MVEPVGDQDHHLVPGVVPELGEDGVLRSPIQGGEGIVQDQDGPGMGQRPGQGQALGLAAGEPHASAAHHGLRALLHGPHLAVQGGEGQPGHGVALRPAEDVGGHGVVPELRIVAQVAHGGRDLPGRQAGKLPPAQAEGVAVGPLPQEGPAQGGLAAGHRPRDADDIAGLRMKAQAPENRRRTVIGKGEILQRDIQRPRNRQRRLGLRRAHQELDALPGNLRPLHGIEELRRLGGLHGQLCIAGEEGGEGGDAPDLPAAAQYVPPAEPEDQDHAEV